MSDCEAAVAVTLRSFVVHRLFDEHEALVWVCDGFFFAKIVIFNHRKLEKTNVLEKIQEGNYIYVGLFLTDGFSEQGCFFAYFVRT